MGNYLITVIGTNQSKQVQAENPQSAIEVAFNTKLGIKYVDVKANPNAVYNVRAELIGGKKKSVNYYYVDKPNLKTPSATNTQTRQTIKTIFVEAAKAERERQVSTIAKFDSSQLEAFVASHSLKTAYKNAQKEGKTGADLGKAMGRENYKKYTKNYEEMLMQAENLSDNYEIVDTSNPQAMLKALATYPCMILARGSQGGVTGFFGTTSLGVMGKLYDTKDKNIYASLKLTSIYEDFLNISDRKLSDIKAGREYHKPETKHKVYQVASCSLRLKEQKVYNRSTKMYVPTGKMVVSSTNYGVVLENVLCMIAYKDVPPVDKTLIEILGRQVLSLTEEQFTAKFAFSRVAFGLAIQTLDEGNLPASFDSAYNAQADKLGVSDADRKTYWQAKQVSLAKSIASVLQEVNRQSTIYSAE